MNDSVDKSRRQLFLKCLNNEAKKERSIKRQNDVTSICVCVSGNEQWSLKRFQMDHFSYRAFGAERKGHKWWSQIDCFHNRHHSFLWTKAAISRLWHDNDSIF